MDDQTELCEGGHQWEPTGVVQQINNTQHLKWVLCQKCRKQEFRVKE
jgi:hypothetical protein